MAVVTLIILANNAKNAEIGEQMHMPIKMRTPQATLSCPYS